MNKMVPVALVIGAAFVFWPAAPDLVTWLLLLVLLVLLLNTWPVIGSYFKS